MHTMQDTEIRQVLQGEESSLGVPLWCELHLSNVLQDISPTDVTHTLPCPAT